MYFCAVYSNTHLSQLSPQTVLHYGWIPLIIYVGFTRSNPQPSLIKYATLKRTTKYLLNASLRLISPLA